MTENDDTGISGYTVFLIRGFFWAPLASIHCNGKRIDEMTPDAIVKLGISHCTEGRMLFPEMPV